MAKLAKAKAKPKPKGKPKGQSKRKSVNHQRMTKMAMTNMTMTMMAWSPSALCCWWGWGSEFGGGGWASGSDRCSHGRGLQGFRSGYSQCWAGAWTFRSGYSQCWAGAWTFRSGYSQCWAGAWTFRWIFSVFRSLDQWLLLRSLCWKRHLLLRRLRQNQKLLLCQNWLFLSNCPQLRRVAKRKESLRYFPRKMIWEWRLWGI